MKKILNIKVPIIKSYKWHAVPLTVLSSGGGNEAWIYNHYLQLCVQEFPQNEHWLEFFSLYDLHTVSNFPWMNTQNIALSLMDKYVDLKSFLIDCIDRGYYIDLLYDLFYIEYSFTYGNEHRTSNLLVYGYDSSEQVFYVMDYTYNGRNIYESIKINMDVLVHSSIESKSRGIKGIYQYDNNYEFSLNKELAITLLQDYLTGSNSIKFIDLTRKYNKRNSAYGVCVYEYLDCFLEMIAKGDTEFNILPFCSLLEHKSCLFLLYEYIKKYYEAPYTDKDKAVCDLAYGIKNMAIKYAVTNNKKILYDVKRNLNNLCILEGQLINTVISALEKI